MSTRQDSNNYAHTRKVSRLPALPEDLDPVLKENFDNILGRGGQIINLHRVTGHAPALARTRGGFIWSLRDGCQVSRQLRELAIVRVAHLTQCSYELDHHVPLAIRAGLSSEQVEALADWRGKEHLFDPPQLSLLAYVEAMFESNGSVDDATFQALADNFTPREIVEITMCATTYYANAFYVKALGIELDGPDAKSAPGRF